MKIYLSHAVNSDYQSELYLPLKESKLSQVHQIFFPHDQKEAVNSKEIIQSSNLILAEVSISATGQGIELGWANASNIPIICLHKAGTTPAGSLKFIANKIITYKDSRDLVNQISISIPTGQ
jgi:hypothetical protein